MIASQFNLDDRLAELRRSGADHRLEGARIASGQENGGTGRGLLDSLRALFGWSSAGRRSVRLAAR